ncbi:MAG: phosphatidylglycerophosphatase A [candidate division KSB1 bacterium]|nr:phosphatidylglycerophosphatase A [candidate division KSB1 bacterium]MDZ7275737.1 phosphatidylglycerophosphatase A [candidate division KSB1 bacterium]MDZ7284572.1 phosphatidylglycerophosphatase A [candidate division KSB1 bacterium]MDZ7298009.1 phosphatidylglycerophosphatase A [candidate division KSB1 bacterium]MDZ7305823.1 phosphatidylglycerophosphatase A [candidate division KSB1 bacterium]
MPAFFHTLAHLIATVGGLGRVRIAPGTAGSLVAALAFLCFPTYLPPLWFTAAVLALMLIGVWAAQRVASARQHSDPSEVIIDEVIGMAVTLAFVPLDPLTIATGFALFRVFDIAKPFPVRQVEKLHGGWGIILDDMAAGVYANGSLRVLAALIPGVLST